MLVGISAHTDLNSRILVHNAIEYHVRQRTPRERSRQRGSAKQLLYLFRVREQIPEWAFET
jgi:hypothetical protein